jgi:putative methyltransferase (TIGR04325 family)
LHCIQWNVVEQAHYVDAGRAFVQDETLVFYNSISACLTQNNPNLILLSSVIQYLKSPIEFIDQLPKTNASILIVDRTPFSSSDHDKLMIQRVPPSIYNASYPMWVFSKKAFLKKLSNDWRLVATTPCSEGKVTSTKGFEFFFEGLILESLH